MSPTPARLAGLVGRTNCDHSESGNVRSQSAIRIHRESYTAARAFERSHFSTFGMARTAGAARTAAAGDFLTSAQGLEAEHRRRVVCGSGRCDKLLRLHARVETAEIRALRRIPISRRRIASAPHAARRCFNALACGRARRRSASNPASARSASDTRRAPRGSACRLCRRPCRGSSRAR